ncbi:MAG: tyrosine-type recombinase/integrase [Desulfitobacterium sp.]
MAHAQYNGIGTKGQAKFRLYYDGPKKPDGSRNQKKESYSVDPLPEKADALAKAAKNRKDGTATKTETILLERFEKKAIELAEAEAKKREDKVNQPNYIEPAYETFKELSERWLEYRAGASRKGKRQPKTLYRYEELLERINAFLGADEVAKINIDRIEEFYAWLAKQTKKPGNRKKTSTKPLGTLSYRTQWHHHRCLYSVIEYGIERRKLESNPCKYVQPKALDQDEDDEGKIDCYTADDVARIRELLENETLQRKTLVTIALEIGPRAGELMALKWSDIDFETRMVTICKSRQYLPGKGSFEKSPKNKSSNRKVRLSASTIFLLRQLKGEQDTRAKILGTKWVESDAVFIGWNGKQSYANWASCWWRNWIRKTDLPVKTFHNLRHTCISLLLAAGANPLEIARMVGHSNAEMLWKVYGHAIEKESFNGADIMQAIMSKKQSENKLDKTKKASLKD